MSSTGAFCLTLLISSLAGISNAVPLSNPGFERLAGLVKRVDNITNYEQICNSHELSDTDAAVRQATWYDTTAGGWLDIWLHENGETDWVTNLDESIQDDGVSVRDCSTLEGGNCPAPESCRVYFDQHAPTVYWIWIAASKAFDAFGYLHLKLQNDVLYNSLTIDSMVEDFDSDPSGDLNIFAILSAAFTIASAVPGLSAVASPALTVAIGSFSMAATLQPEGPDPGTAVRDQLAATFLATQAQIEDTLKLAFGRGEDTSQLPNQGGEFQTATANFFSDGRWLIQNVEEVMESVVDTGSKRMREGLVNVLMKNQGYFVMVNTDIEDEASCTDGAKGAAWLNDQCNELYVFQDPDVLLGHDVDDGLIEKMVNDYQIDLTEMFKTAWDCALAHPDGNGKVDSDTVPYDGSLPECFWNIAVVRGTYEEFGHVVTAGDVDTSGRDTAPDNGDNIPN